MPIKTLKTFFEGRFMKTKTLAALITVPFFPRYSNIIKFYSYEMCTFKSTYLEINLLPNFIFPHTLYQNDHHTSPNLF